MRARVERVQAASLAAIPAQFGEFSLALVGSIEASSVFLTSAAFPFAYAVNCHLLVFEFLIRQVAGTQLGTKLLIFREFLALLS